MTDRKDHFYYVIDKRTGDECGTELIDLFVSSSESDLDATAQAFRRDGWKPTRTGLSSPSVRVLRKDGEELVIRQSRVTDVEVQYLAM